MLFSVYSVPSIPSALATESSEKAIDSFNVHPKNRWDITEYDMDHVGVADGILNVSDVGDGSIDKIYMDRGLRDMDGTVSMRFKYSTNASAYEYYNSMYLFIEDPGTNNYVYFQVYGMKDGVSYYTKCAYKNNAGGTETLLVNSDERVYSDTWYVIRMDYDLYLAKMRWRLYFDNGSEVFDYEWTDIDEDNQPALFQFEEIFLRYQPNSQGDQVWIQHYVDYIEAPFKERAWENTDVPSDSDWLANSWDAVHVQDDINDISDWRLTVPRLDAVSGTFTAGFDDASLMNNGDNAYMSVNVYAVDADDGDLHSAVALAIGHVNVGVGDAFSISLNIDGSEIWGYTAVGTTRPICQFTISLTDDRSRIGLEARVWLDDTDSSTYEDVIGSADISDIATDPSHEFVLEIEYVADFDCNTEWEALIYDYSLTYRDIFKGIGDFFGGIFGGVGDFLSGGIDFISDIFATIFRWLGELFASAIAGLGELLTAALSLVEAAVGLVEDAISAMQTALESAIALVEDAVDGLIAYIQDIGDFVITELISAAQNILDALFDAMEFLVDELIQVVFWIYDEAMLALGFSSPPDLIALFNSLVWLIGEVITSIPTLVGDIENLMAFWTFEKVIVLIFVFLVFLPFMMGATNTDGIGNIIKVNTYPIQILGFGIPIGLLLFVVIGALGLF